MTMNLCRAVTACAIATFAFTAPAFADGHGTWASVASESRVAFGSVKNNENGEVHHFNAVDGAVSGDGKLSITIDLGSIQTNIDIRNERMTKTVFLSVVSTNGTAWVVSVVRVFGSAVCMI